MHLSQIEADVTVLCGSLLTARTQQTLTHQMLQRWMSIGFTIACPYGMEVRHDPTGELAEYRHRVGVLWISDPSRYSTGDHYL